MATGDVIKATIDPLSVFESGDPPKETSEGKFPFHLWKDIGTLLDEIFKT